MTSVTSSNRSNLGLGALLAGAICLLAPARALATPGTAPAPPSTERAVPTTVLATPGGWRFHHDRGVRVADGVSVEAVRTAEGAVRLYATGRGGIAVYRSDDGLRFRRETATTPPGSDAAIVDLGGRLRMYYVAAEGDPQPPADPANVRKSVRSATSGDGLNWQTEEGQRLADAGYGVPDVVALPGGGWRIYWVARGASRASIIHSAVSQDGLGFTEEAGGRLPPDYVDPAVVRLASGTWLMAVATLPRRGYQRIHLATSADGFRWRLDRRPLIAPRGRSALDPALLPLGGNRFRVYYSTARGLTFGGPFRVESGTLRPA